MQMLKKINALIILILLFITNINVYAIGNTTTNDINKSNILQNNNNTRWYNIAPWTFSWGYHFLTEDLLNIIKANLKVSDSMLQMENNFKVWNLTSLEEDYLDAIQYVKNDKTIDEKFRAKVLKDIDTPEMRMFVSDILYWIMKMEHWWDTKSNPINWQWVFQLYWIENCWINNHCWTSFNRDRIYYLSRDQYDNIYKPNKILKRPQYLAQFVDMLYYISNNLLLTSRIRDLSQKNKNITYEEQLDVILRAFNDVLNITKEQRNTLINWIIRKDEATVWTFINQHANALKDFNIKTPEDMFIWLYYIKVASIGEYYNWHYNNLSRVKNDIKPKSFLAPAFNVFDNNYVSNAETYWICFHTIQWDWWKMAWTKNGDWLILNLLKFKFPNNYQEKQVAFASMIWKMIETWLTKWQAVNCGK